MAIIKIQWWKFIVPLSEVLLVGAIVEYFHSGPSYLVALTSLVAPVILSLDGEGSIFVWASAALIERIAKKRPK